MEPQFEKWHLLRSISVTRKRWQRKQESDAKRIVFMGVAKKGGSHPVMVAFYRKSQK